MTHLKMGEIISKRRKEQGLTQNQLAGRLNISFQAVSKWENGAAYPDIEMLPRLAAVLDTTVDALLGYAAVMADYDSRYDTESYYWGLIPNRICYDIMRLLPPVKPYRVLDIGCGEGKDAVFFAKCGYDVTAFDLSEKGIEKAKRLAQRNKAELNLFRADLLDYQLKGEYDVIFSSGTLHFLPPARRKPLCDSLKAHTAAGGIHGLNVFVEKPFLPPASNEAQEEEKGKRHPWRSGELFEYYHDWLFHVCREEILDCASGGTPHKHCMDTLIAEKKEGRNGDGSDL